MSLVIVEEYVKGVLNYTPNLTLAAEPPLVLNTYDDEFYLHRNTTCFGDGECYIFQNGWKKKSKGYFCRCKLMDCFKCKKPFPKWYIDTHLISCFNFKRYSWLKDSYAEK